LDNSDTTKQSHQSSQRSIQKMMMNTEDQFKRGREKKKEQDGE
jgi:hypothetical protein